MRQTTVSIASVRLALLGALCICCTCAYAARPFFTDDARVVDKGHCQLETFYKEQRTYSGSEFWFLPACNPLGFELTIGGKRIERERNEILQTKLLLKPLEPNAGERCCNCIGGVHERRSAFDAEPAWRLS